MAIATTRAQERREQREPGPVQQPREDVATRAVGAEEVLPARVGEGVADVGVVRVERCDQGREHGREHDESEEGEREDAERIAEHPSEGPALGALGHGWGL